MRNIISAVTVLTIVFSFNNTLQAQVARLVHYEGKLLNADGTPFNGTTNLHFGLYRSLKGEEPLWQETHENVAVQSGKYDVLLGGVNPLKLSFYEYFLEVKADNGQSEEARTMIVGSGYNYRLWFLFSAYTIVWLAIFIYMLMISRRQRKIIAELELLTQYKDESQKA